MFVNFYIRLLYFYIKQAADLIIKVKEVSVDFAAISLGIRYQLTCVPATNQRAVTTAANTVNMATNHRPITAVSLAKYDKC